MKKYNVPATEVVAFASGLVMQTASPATQNPNPNNNNPASTGGEEIP